MVQPSGRRQQDQPLFSFLSNIGPGQREYMRPYRPSYETPQEEAFAKFLFEQSLPEPSQPDILSSILMMPLKMQQDLFQAVFQPGRFKARRAEEPGMTELEGLLMSLPGIGAIPAAALRGATLAQMARLGTTYAGAGARATVRATVREAGAVGRTVGQRTRRAMAEQRGGPMEDAMDRYTERLDLLDELEEELANVKAMLEVTAEETKTIRPPWAVGLTNAELRAIAKQEGVDIRNPDWFDALDSKIIREAKQGAYQGYKYLAPDTGKAKSAMSARALNLEDQIAETKAEIARLETVMLRGGEPERITGTAIQPGMGIGERPQQGQLMAETLGAGERIPLADVEQVAKRIARKQEVAQGQAEMPMVAERATETRAVPEVVGPIEVEIRFPPGPELAKALRSAKDPDIGAVIENSGMRRVVVDPPYSFDLSQEAGVAPGGIVRLNPDVMRPANSLLHEAGHIMWDRASTAEKKFLTDAVSSIRALLAKHAPGYLREFQEGSPEEAVAGMFALLKDPEMPAALRAKLVAFQPSGRSLEAAYGVISSAVPQSTKVKSYVKSWEAVEKEDFGYIREGFDFAEAIRRYGDVKIGLEDVNGGTHWVPASVGARLLDDPISSGYIKEVRFWSAKQEVRLDDYTLNFLPELAKGLARVAPELADASPAVRRALSAADVEHVGLAAEHAVPQAEAAVRAAPPPVAAELAAEGAPPGALARIERPVAPSAPGELYREGPPTRYSRLANELAEAQITLAREVGGPPLVPPTVTRLGTIGPGGAGIPERFVARIPSFSDEVAGVVTASDPLTRALIGHTGINPSILVNTPAGKAVIAFYRQLMKGEIARNVALQAGLDFHAQAFTGRLGKVLPITREGFFGTTKRLWQDVFEDVLNGRAVSSLTAEQRAYVDDYGQIIREVNAQLVEEGVVPLRLVETLKVPRTVEKVRGVEVTRPSSPRVQRYYDEATEGYAKGIRYSTDPRASLEAYMRWAHRETLMKRMSEHLEPISVTGKEILQAKAPGVITVYENALAAAVKKAKELRALQGDMRGLQVGEEPAAKVGGAPAAAAKLRAARMERREALAARIQVVKTELAVLTHARNQARHAYSNALDAARRSTVAPGKLFGRLESDIPVGVWHNRFFPQKDYDALVKGVGMFGRPPDDVNAFVRVIGQGIAYVKLLAATGDWALPFIQGAPILVRHPAIWGESAARHYWATLQPVTQAAFIRANLSEARRLAKAGVPVGDVEFFTALEQGRGIPFLKPLEAIPGGKVIRTGMRQVGKQTFGRFMTSYSTGLTTNRILMLKGMAPGWGGTDAELGQLLRNLSGALDPRALGVAPAQRELEAMWLAFAPKLLRSTMALSKDALVAWNTPQGRAAAQNIAFYLAGIHGLYVLTGMALQRPWEDDSWDEFWAYIKKGLTPTSGKQYLSHRINNDWVGVGGQVRAMTQVLYGAIAAAVPGGSPPSALITGDKFDNPILSFYYARGALATSVFGGAAELVTRRDVLPFENIDSAPDLLKHVGRSAMPFVAQNIAEGQSTRAVLIALGGLRTSAATPSERRRDMEQAVMKAMGLEGEYADLPADMKSRVREDVHMAPFTEAVEERKRTLGDPFQAYQDEREGIRTNYQNRILGAAMDLPVGEDLRRQMDKLHQEQALELRLLQRRNEKLLADVEAGVAEFKEGRISLDPQFDEAFVLYLEQVNDPGLEDYFTGEYNFAERNKRIAGLEARFGGPVIDRVREHLHRNETPIETELREVREFLRPYWEIPQEVARTLGVELMYQDYLAEPDGTFLKQDLARILRIAGVLNGRTSLMRRALRMLDYDIDRALLRWGYTEQPLNLRLKDEQVELRAAGAR